uniref:CASAMP second calponin-homology domain-containing protein n=2 Tax=Passeriformes TaxID=9126 RepID=A0A803VYN1_FICAL
MEVWRQCAHWLVAARVLPAGHRASSPGGQVWDLAQALRDGVLLCHLLNALLPRAVPPRDICPRPQMSQVRWGQRGWSAWGGTPGRGDSDSDSDSDSDNGGRRWGQWG